MFCVGAPFRTCISGASSFAWHCRLPCSLTDGFRLLRRAKGHPTTRPFGFAALLGLTGSRKTRRFAPQTSYGSFSRQPCATRPRKRGFGPCTLHLRLTRTFDRSHALRGNACRDTLLPLLHFGKAEFQLGHVAACRPLVERELDPPVLPLHHHGASLFKSSSGDVSNRTCPE